MVLELDDVTYHKENPLFDMAYVFKLCKSTRFSKLFSGLKMGIAENNIVNNNEADTDNSFAKLQ